MEAGSRRTPARAAARPGPPLEEVSSRNGKAKTHMKRLLVAFAALLVVPVAYAQAPAGQAPVEMKASGTPGKATAKRTVHVTATIKAIDVPGRTVTLQNKAGETETFKAGPEIQRLEDFAVGDTVVIDYEQGLALEFQPAGSETVAPSAVVTGARADKTQPPG